MNEKTLVAVSAYAGDAHQIEQNLPVYLHHGCPIVILTPEDAPITKLSTSPSGVDFRSMGKKGWIGPQTLERHALYLKFLLSTPAHFDWFLFHDADSICLSRQIPNYLYKRPDVAWSNEVVDTNPGHSYLPKIAMQPPYFFSRAILAKLVEFVDKPAPSYTCPTPHGPLPVPTGCIDHYHLQVVKAAGVAHQSYPDGASFETSSDLGIEQMGVHVNRFGKCMIHSVKTTKALHHLIAEYAAYVRRISR